MKKTIGLMFVIASASIFAMAVPGPPPPMPTPEIGGPAALVVLTLVSGGLLIYRARRKK